jgi:mRNA interferase MazF
MRRGDLATIAMPGDFGKPRPALIVQADQFEDTGTVTVLLLSGTLVDAPLIRPTVRPTLENGLRKPSQVMIDKAMSVKRDKIGPTFGRLDDETMLSVTRSLAVFLGIA